MQDNESDSSALVLFKTLTGHSAGVGGFVVELIKQGPAYVAFLLGTVLIVIPILGVLGVDKDFRSLVPTEFTAMLAIGAILLLLTSAVHLYVYKRELDANEDIVELRRWRAVESRERAAGAARAAALAEGKTEEAAAMAAEKVRAAAKTLGVGGAR